jgi:hypothetical protein
MSRAVTCSPVDRPAAELIRGRLLRNVSAAEAQRGRGAGCTVFGPAPGFPAETAAAAAAELDAIVEAEVNTVRCVRYHGALSALRFIVCSEDWLNTQAETLLPGTFGPHVTSEMVRFAHRARSREYVCLASAGAGGV